MNGLTLQMWRYVTVIQTVRESESVLVIVECKWAYSKVYVASVCWFNKVGLISVSWTYSTDLFHWLIDLISLHQPRSVQKLSEFFSSDEIGDEQDPRVTLTSGSSNHNQNRYQAVVSTWKLIYYGSDSIKRWSGTKCVSCAPLLPCAGLSLWMVFSSSILLSSFVSGVARPSTSLPLNLSLHPPPPPPRWLNTVSPWRW